MVFGVAIIIGLPVAKPKENVFIMGYVTFSLGCYMVCCSVASLAVGYIYMSCSHLYSFASYPFIKKVRLFKVKSYNPF